MGKIMRASLFAASITLSGSVLAAPCAGFTDVDDTAFSPEVCQSVEWLKNRGITIGCSSQTTFCPFDFVPRSQMALFMKRLGTKLTSEILYSQETLPPGTSFAGVRPSCIIGPIDVLGYPRAATVSGWVLLHPSAAGHLIGAGAVFSTDGGATWNAVGGADYFAGAPTSPTDHRSISVTSGAQAMEVGQSIFFGLGIGQFAGLGPSLANTDCAITLRIENRNGVAPPFDPAAAPVKAIGANLRP